ncbi:MAG TPA: hypothetical protein VH933_15110 [Aestuariivirgaceae bacterium]|jgi:hypothetical protein
MMLLPRLTGIAKFLVLLALAGCDDSGGPAASLAGGGFVFNYRIGEAFYGVVVKIEKDLPQQAVIEAEFQDPAGGNPIEMSEPIRSDRRKYMLRTRALKGVKQGVPYKVVVEILDKPGGEVIQRLERTFKSDIDQSILPEAPLVVGPGYTPNPENDITKTP